MDNTIDYSSDSEFEWNVDDKKDNKSVFLNNEKESDVLNKMKTIKTSNYKILLSSDESDFYSNNGNITKYNDTFSFKNVTSISLSNITWNVPECTWFDIIIPSFPSECFYLSHSNDSIIYRNAGSDYDIKDNVESFDIYNELIGTGPLNTDTDSSINLNITDMTKNIITFILDTNQQIAIKFKNKYNNFDDLSDSLTKQTPNLQISLEDDTKLSFSFNYGNITNIQELPQNTVPSGDHQWLTTLFGDNGYNINDDPSISYTTHISKKDLDISTIFKSPVNLDLNNIKIYVKLFFSESLLQNKLKKKPWVNFKNLNNKLIEIYPKNKLEINNLLTMIEATESIKKQFENINYKKNHLYTNFNITCSNS